MTRLFTFIGVTTGQSSIGRIFPLWRDLLGLGEDVRLEGVDIPLHAPPAIYRQAVTSIKEDKRRLGALVTTHKIDLYHAAHDLFDGVDEYARLCGEVSCIAKREGQLRGWAKDPISAGRVLNRMLGSGYFTKTGGHVLCFGAGGAGVAITLYLVTRPDRADRPERIVVTDLEADRLASLRALHARLNSDVVVEYVQTASGDEVLSRCPGGSLVINATGMGKDRPGSPISASARFPDGGIAWELNYRGELGFLRVAWAQHEARKLRVEDGWQYFIYGWLAIMEEVFDRPVSEDELRALSEAASFARPPLSTRVEAAADVGL